MNDIFIVDEEGRGGFESGAIEQYFRSIIPLREREGGEGADKVGSYGADPASRS